MSGVNVLNYGAGVNSTAMLLLVMHDDRFWDFRTDLEIIFADTGGEWPETYQYIDRVFIPMIRERYGLNLLRVSDTISLEERSRRERMVPARVNRWCTDKHKIRPIYRYYKALDRWPVRQMLGIDYGEFHRMRGSDNWKIEFHYPLVEAKLDRNGCKALIEKHGLPIPNKSGCFYCPFQRRSEWVKLARRHPGLYHRAIEMEERGIKFDQGRYISDVGRPLREWVPRRMAQGDLFPDLHDEGYCMEGCEITNDLE